jgi:hypothetical protein
MFYKIVISLNVWFKRHALCKSMKKRKKIWTHEGPSIWKMMSTWRLMWKKKKKEKEDSHVLKIKLMREVTHIKEYSIGLTLFYPHTCTSWSKGMPFFLLRSEIWLSKICRVSMPSYLSLPKDPYKVLEIGKNEGNTMICLGAKHIYERSERIIWGAKLCLYFLNSHENPSF